MSKCMTLTNGICRGCLDNIGGVKKVYFANTKELYCAEPTFTVSTTEPGAIENISFGGTTPKFYKLEPSKNTANYVETINISQENGTMYYNGVLSVNYNKQETLKRNVVSELAKGDSTVIFVDGNNKYWLFTGLNVTTAGGVPTGFSLDGDNGCVLGGTSFQTGTAKADANGAALTFTCDMSASAVELIRPAGATTGIWPILDTADEDCAECA